MDTTSKQIKFGAILSYLALAINFLTGLIYTPWMIHSIGKENYGLYALAMSVISLFVFDFGLSSAVTRFIAKYLAEGKTEKANDCLGLVYRLYFIIDAVLFIILAAVYFFIPTIYKELTPEEIDNFKVIYVMVAIYSVLSFPFIPANGVLTAHEKFIPLKLCDIIQKVLIVVVMTICLLLGYGLYALVLVNIITGLLMILMKLWVIHYKTPQRINAGYYNKNEFKEILGYSGWVTIIALAQRCIFNLAPTILGALSGSTAIAIMGIAITLEGYTFTFANALNGMFLPKVSRILASKDGNVLPFMIKVGRIQLLIIGLIIITFICVGRGFINLWVGDQFDQSYLCAILIIVPSIFQLPQEIGVQTLVAANKLKLQAYTYICMAVLNLIGAAILSPYYGAVGISISICIAYIVRTFGLDIILKKTLNINVKEFFRESFIKMLPSFALTLVLGLALVYWLPILSWTWLIVDSVIIVFIFCTLAYVFTMNSYEKDLILTPILKKLNK